MFFGKRLVEKAYALCRQKVDTSCIFEGCSVEEIKQLMLMQKVDTLPRVYMDFLLHLGRKSGDLYVGLDIGYNPHRLYNYKEKANKLLAICGLEELDHKHFVFMNRQSITFWYFEIILDDPPVFMYVPDCEAYGDYDPTFANGGVMIAPKLSYFLTEFIAEKEGEETRRNFLSGLVLL